MGHTSPTGTKAAPAAAARRWRDWPVSRRLTAVAVIAVMADLALGGLRLISTTESTMTFSHVTQLAVLGQRVTDLARAMEDERDQIAGFVAAGRPAEGTSAVNRAESRTNQAAAQVAAFAKDIGAGFPATTQAKVTTVLDRIADLPGLRQAAVNTQLPSLPVILDYSAAIADLFTLNDEIAQGSADPAVADGVRALGRLGRLEEAASRQRALLDAALTEGSFEPGALADLITAQSTEAGYLQAFQTTATPGLQQAFSDQVTGTQVDEAQLIEQRVITTGSPQTSGLGLPAGNPPDEWYAAMTGTLTPIRSVEDQLTRSIIAQSQALQAGPWRSAWLTIVLMTAVLVFVLAATLLVARSLVIPLRRLKTGALEIAAVSLPGRVKELTERPDIDPDLNVQPIDVHSADEIGQVARAFDQVHAEALRLAGNEAILRRNVSAMFVSLSHRSQTSIERLSQMITTPTSDQRGGALRPDLAAMERLLGRMRRHCENLLVLAGYEPVRKRTGPVQLTEVAHAAAAGIDPDRRLSLTISPGLAVAGHASTDITHLLAELVENAANFSPGHAPITVSASPLADGGIQVDVADNGIGLKPDRLTEMNARLAAPPVADALVSRHMGLFAVAHLAARHGALVRLQHAPKGTTAQVWLPAAITANGTVGHDSAAGSGVADRDAVRTVIGFTQAADLRQSGAQATLRQSGAQPAIPEPGAATEPVIDPSALIPPARTTGGLPLRNPRRGRHAADPPAGEPQG